MVGRHRAIPCRSRMSLPPAAEQVPLHLPSGSPDWRTFLRVLGPAYLVAVGYMDPGNWATDLAAGSSYGYSLLWVVALSSLMAMVLRPAAACCRRVGACRCGCWPRWPSWLAISLNWWAVPSL